MPLPLCNHAITICEMCGVRAHPLYQLAVRMPGGKFIVATVCDSCHVRLVPRLAVMAQR